MDVLQKIVEIWFVGQAFLAQGYTGVQDQRGWNGSAPLAALAEGLSNLGRRRTLDKTESSVNRPAASLAMMSLRISQYWGSTMWLNILARQNFTSCESVMRRTEPNLPITSFTKHWPGLGENAPLEWLQNPPLRYDP